MAFQSKYFVIDNQGRYEENENGHIPGVTWSDSNHSYRAIITRIDFTDFIVKSCSYTYLKQIKPLGIADWIDYRKETISINNRNWVDTSDLSFIDNPYELVEYEGQMVPKIDTIQNKAPQFDVFTEMVGKNPNGLPISLFSLLLERVVTLEGL